MKMGLENRPILVTGAYGGIGAATVRLLRGEGADVIASGRNEEALLKLKPKPVVAHYSLT